MNEDKWMAKIGVLKKIANAGPLDAAQQDDLRNVFDEIDAQIQRDIADVFAAIPSEEKDQ